jgi:glycosyltransferase involved in cell wall biosynthesis
VKILMHCVYYAPEVGGLESHVHYLCRALVQMGHRVDVVTSHSMKETPRLEVVDGVHVHRTWFPRKSTMGWIAHAVGSVPATLAAARDADILHAQAFQSIPPMLAARAGTGAPLVSTWHTSHFLRLALRPGWATILGRLVAAGDANLAASAEIASVAESLAPRHHVEPVTNGVETSIFHASEPDLPTPESGRRRLIVPRRLFEKNGVEFFVRAIPLIIERHNVEAVLVGDGPERGHLEALAGELGVLDRVHFLGARAHAHMPGLLSSAELAIFPSLMEATSVAALECMACEVPVAASRVGGLPEIVDESVGGLFTAADPADLARVVSELLGDPDLASRGKAGRARVIAQWSNERLAQYHLELYEELIRRQAA